MNEKEYNKLNNPDKIKGDEEMTTLAQRLNANPFLSKYNNSMNSKNSHFPNSQEITSFNKEFKECIEPISLETLSKIKDIER